LEVADVFGRIRRLLLGKPLPTARQIHERLPKFLALPIFASDALSSVAYATEEILLALAVVIGVGAWNTSQWIAVAIAILLGIVALSYRQTIFAYPQGGGSYTVTKENLGIYPGLVAAASLLTDYVLTVSVSIAAGVAAIVSAYPDLAPHKVLLGIMFVALVALANLRGVRESGWLFAPPTYIFIFSLFTMVVVGLFKAITHAPINHIIPISEPVHAAGAITIFLVLRAFAGGCAALTGTEAIANGIPAFRPPESKNAAATIIIMAFILGMLFIGTTYLAHLYRVLPVEGGETVVSQIARGTFGRGWFYYLIQYATAAILILAANTAFQDFPRLSSILARDRFAPRQLANVGDKLVFSNGIVALAIIAALLIVIFHGETHALIPLYAVGVFITFTLSQTGMVVRHLQSRGNGWRAHAIINSIGAFATGVVSIVIASVKFVHGAYIVIILIPTLVFVFYKIHQHYIELGNRLRLSQETFEDPEPVKSTAIVLVSSIHKGIMPALKYARSLSDDCRALYIETDQTESILLQERWPQFGLNIPLVILESPYRTIIGPLLKYIEMAKEERSDHIITVVLPEFVMGKWWHKILHNQSSLLIKLALMTRRDIIITNVRYFVDDQIKVKERDYK
jgi:amino acid transporter